ncbi:MAG: Gldg family protein [Thiohalocapsa sp.]|uniref:Gldg family protein n=1 Tax=Thiohalocapsa sp. TaxID=2497641 RepID=UPI0025D045C0|nr:Gldg family protein [Thiohalocapsa sp.]MCG6941604.1 Gldg family protein [Thiohalocapsa sp.]
MSDILRTTRKELSSFFGSPVAYLFIGAFLAACLFVFFWVEAFFARNIADTRPLFDWMPLLLIFLAAALTMRLWSEERRAGTWEALATLPVPTWKLVLGKFLAALALVAVALALTLPLPVTVSFLGQLDWGPVLGAYLATLLLAAAYIAIGLFVSARTDNPIVALIGTTLLCAVFYLIGSPVLTNLFGHGGGELLRLLGTGSRFESITRGVVDLRDLYYYLSLVGVFLALCIYSLERLRWAADSDRQASHHRWQLITVLAVANLVAANLWLQQVGVARADLTEGKIYTVSEATRNYLHQLQEPLLIRGYFSAETHPKLAPLVPQLRDLLREYEVVGGPNVRVEFVDPATSPELEREAGEKYGIRPVAFQTEGKYQSGVVNSYFNILVKYGDQFEVLGFQDLIEIKDQGDTDLEVRLRNPEYDLTRTIKKVLYGYRGGGDAFAGIGEPIHFRGFISAADALPEPLPAVRKDLEAVLTDLAEEANRDAPDHAEPARFDWKIENPDADPKLAAEIDQRFGFQPVALGLLDPRPFYFFMVLEQGGRAVPVPLPEGLDKAGLRRAIEAGIKRFAPGVLRTVALYTPEPAPAGFPGMPQPSGPGYTLLKDTLRQGFALRETDLGTGQVPDDTDLLFVVDPTALDEKQQFAVDQFLMQGGTVVLATSSFDVDLTGNALSAAPSQTGLENWLEHQGVQLARSLVLDPQSSPFPIPVQRQIGGFTVEEIQKLDYPYFADVRADGLAKESGITANLGQLTMNWSSPITLDADKNAGRKVTRLIESSRDAWTSDAPDLQPDIDKYGSLGFPRGKDRGRKLLALSIEGRFDSAFAGKRSPLLPPEKAQGEKDDKGGAADAKAVDAGPAAEAGAPAVAADAAAGEGTDAKPKQPVVSTVVEHSPSSARLIVIGSDTFLSDVAIDLATRATGTEYLKPLELVQNAVEWSLEDRGLLALRGRGQFSRLLSPVSQEAQMIWEYLNYALAALGLVLVYWLHRVLRRRRERALTEMLAGGQ